MPSAAAPRDRRIHHSTPNSARTISHSQRASPSLPGVTSGRKADRRPGPGRHCRRRNPPRSRHPRAGRSRRSCTTRAMTWTAAGSLPRTGARTTSRPSRAPPVRSASAPSARRIHPGGAAGTGAAGVPSNSISSNRSPPRGQPDPFGEHGVTRSGCRRQIIRGRAHGDQRRHRPSLALKHDSRRLVRGRRDDRARRCAVADIHNRRERQSAAAQPGLASAGIGGRSTAARARCLPTSPHPHGDRPR